MERRGGWSARPTYLVGLSAVRRADMQHNATLQLACFRVPVASTTPHKTKLASAGLATVVNSPVVWLAQVRQTKGLLLEGAPCARLGVPRRMPGCADCAPHCWRRVFAACTWWHADRVATHVHAVMPAYDALRRPNRSDTGTCQHGVSARTRLPWQTAFCLPRERQSRGSAIAARLGNGAAY